MSLSAPEKAVVLLDIPPPQLWQECANVAIYLPFTELGPDQEYNTLLLLSNILPGTILFKILPGWSPQPF